MASVNSPIRNIIKPLLYKVLGKRGYRYAQFFGKMRDIDKKLVEEKEMSFLPFIVKNGDTVFDIGANYAYYTSRLSDIVGNTGKVFAFEPIPFTHSVCEMIVKKRNLTNVKLFQVGVGERNQNLVFNVPQLNFGGISAGQAHISGREHEAEAKKEYYNFAKEEQVVCKVVSLDDFITEELTDISFIKIDIEGAEYFALKGMYKLIAKHLPIILIEVQPYFLKGFGINEAEFRNYIVEVLGYDIYIYNEAQHKLNLMKGDFFDANFILVPRNKIEKYSNLIAQ